MHAIATILDDQSSAEIPTAPAKDEKMTDPQSEVEDPPVGTNDPPAAKATQGGESPEKTPSAEAAAAAEAAKRAELEARAVAEATASADASYVPTPSLLNSPTAAPLLKQVDGPSVKGYTGKESTYVAKKVPVPLRGRLDVPIHISAGGSVVSYTIETENYDIAFGITAEREEGITVVNEPNRVNAHIEPVSGKFLVGSVPCAIVFSFDNEYSWFREKQVTYRISVRPPSRDNVVSGRRRRAKAALKAVRDDAASAEARLERTSKQRTTLAAEIARMEKEIAEKKKSLDVAEKEEGWLKDRVKLRKEQDALLNQRLNEGWPDEKE